MGDEIQQTRYDKLIRRVGNIIGPGSKVGSVIPELFPMLDVENVPGELLLLGNTDICLGSASVQGAGGEQGNVSLFNPDNSGKIVTISYVYVTTSSVQTIRMGLAAGSTGIAVGSETFRDLRRGFVSRPVGAIFSEAGGTITVPDLQMRTVANAQIELEDRNSIAVLPPGTRFEVGSDTVATLILVNFLWRERPASESELNIPQ